MAKKLQLGYREIEQRLSLTPNPSPVREGSLEIAYWLLYSFGKSERDIERYKEGKGVLKTFDGLLIKGLFCYRPATTIRLTAELERLKRDPQVLKAAPKIIAVSDGKTLLAYDLRERDTYENPVNRLYCDFAFFYPLMDVERVHYVEESPADIKAAEKLAKLHDELRAYNDFRSDSDLHDLNIFITRLLFCFFAEDTGIFEENLFTSSIQRFTKPDGSDLSQYLDESFNVMDVSFRRQDIPSIVKQFPYVNGGLFSRHIQIPRMGEKARRLIIECGELDWKDINPDIFGSMIQAVVNPEERANQGMHYTSVPNIMKVINPLFMDELRGEYNKLNEQYEKRHQMLDIEAITAKQFYDDLKPVIKKCQALLKRMGQMKFFDPACGSGNFLIITYKCLRFLEMDILRLQQKCMPMGELIFVDASVIQLNQFYGIELLDFPHEVAMLSLWLAEHQMNTKLNKNFGVNTHALPLKNITQIICGNACRIDWNKVCPHTKEEEVFVFGNPPYLGSAWQDKEQKNDMSVVFRGFNNYKNLDYIACWFWKGSQYIENTNAKFAFDTTNSICQGEQVSMLWKPLLKKSVYISFAHQSFKWSNNAKYNAGVYCNIVGLSSLKKQVIRLYTDSQVRDVEHLNGYLMPASDIAIGRIPEPIADLPPICKGSMARDDGNLILGEYERNVLVGKYPQIAIVIKPFIGAAEFMRGLRRYCLWITDELYPLVKNIPEIQQRLKKVSIFRRESDAPSTQAYANRPYLFVQRTYKDENFVYIPQVTSERRKYVPIGLFEKGTITSDKAFSVYGGGIYVLGILSSLMHIVWFRTFGGRLKQDYSYSSNMCYNSFPFPPITPEKKSAIEAAAEDVLVTREFYPERTLAELYDPDNMPQDLREAHAKLDDIVESCYPGYPFASDEARLECLFKLYEKMTKK